MNKKLHTTHRFVCYVYNYRWESVSLASKKGTKSTQLVSNTLKKPITIFLKMLNYLKKSVFPVLYGVLNPMILQ